MKYFVYLLLVLIGVLYGCTSAPGGREREANSIYQLDTISPASAFPGTRVLLYGKNFPDSLPKVWFGDVVADSVISASPFVIEVVVPKMKEGSGQVYVASKDDKLYSNSQPFVIRPLPQNVRPVYFTTHKIHKGEISPENGLVIQELVEESHPRGLKVDHGSNTLYWGNYYGYLKKFNMDSMELEVIFAPPAGDELLDVAWTSDHQHAFVCKEDKIIRHNLHDSSRNEVLYEKRASPFQIALSGDEERLYWIEWDALTIYTASSTNNSEEPISFLTPDDGLTGPRAFVIDEEDDKVYIADAAHVGTASIMVYDLVNKSMKRVLTTEQGAGTLITDLILDKENGYLYWMNSKGRNHHYLGDGEILRAPLKNLSKPEVVIQPINWGHLLSF